MQKNALDGRKIVKNRDNMRKKVIHLLANRVPPHNIEAEEAVLGAMFLSHEAAMDASEMIRPEDFYRVANRMVFQSMQKLIQRNEVVDLVTVTEELRTSNLLEQVGGILYVTSLANAVPTAANLSYYTKIVTEKARLRELIQAATEIACAAFEESDDQLPPVGAGEPFKALIEAGAGTAYLEDIRRQRDLELLEAVRQSVKGDPLKTYEILKSRGDYHQIGDKFNRMMRIRNLMAKAPLEDYRKQLLLVSSNADRKEYNEIIRNEYRCKGEIEDGWDFWITAHNGEKDMEEKRRFAPRDRIIFTSNDKRLGVLNGTMGQIEAIKGNIFTVRTDSGEQVTFDMGQYNSIDYSYAVTNYKAQGMGVELAVADMPTSGRGQTRNAAYVDLSRAKQRAIVFTDSKERLEKQTRAFIKKVSSKDFAKRIERMVKRGYVVNNERYHATKNHSCLKILGDIRRRSFSHITMDYEMEVDKNLWQDITDPNYPSVILLFPTAFTGRKDRRQVDKYAQI